MTKGEAKNKLIIGGLAMAMATMANASELTKDRDKTFPKSDKVEHAKAMFKNRFGIAPTAKNQQPFHIYVLQSKEALAKVNELTRCAYEAPVVFIVCYDKSKAWVSPFDANDNSGVMDTSIVGTHMMLEAFEQGLGSCWVKFFDAKQVAAAFDIPDNLTPSFLLDIGYPLKGTAPSKMHFEKREVKDFTTYR